ncbi:MAG: alpha/beta hydrolase [Sphingomonadaceae bacterium]|nr:alpha/beta hydrolase [Sphingomonadaceae bacterium]
MKNRRGFTVRTPEGVLLGGVRQGQMSDTPLILLHGYSDTHRSFEPLLNELPESIDVIAFTQRGHGDSSKPDNDYSASAFARDLDAMLDAQDCQSTVIVGHSMGSRIALRFALDYPDRVAGLVLIGAFASFADNPGVQALWDEDVSKLADPVDPEFVRAFQTSASSEHLSKQLLDDAVSESLKMPARVWRGALRAMLDEELIDDLDSITVQVKLIWGNQDPFAGRADQDRLLFALPRASLFVAEGFGHSPHWEKPQLAAQEIVHFCHEVGRSEATQTSRAAA